MRAATLFGLLVLSVLGFCQSSQPPPNLFQTARPTLVVVVSKSDLGPDTVEITSVDSGFSPSHMADQVADFGKRIPSEIRGLSVKPYGVGQVRATFAVVGLIQRDRNILGLEPLCRAFAQGVDGKPNTLMVQYQTETANPHLLQYYENPGLVMEALSDSKLGLEYRIKLLSTDPNRITIPEGRTAEDLKAKPKVTPQGSGVSPTILVLIVITALAVGALVYSLLLRPRPKTASK